jgi:hypothetical protein
MDNQTNDVRPDQMQGLEFLPVRERWDQTSYAVASFLARYRDLTLRAYRQDMLAFLRWCAGITATRPAAGRAAASRAVLALDGVPRAGSGDDRAPLRDGRRVLQVRRPGRERYGEPDPGRDPAQDRLGRATPNRAAPARVRRPADGRPA